MAQLDVFKKVFIESEWTETRIVTIQISDKDLEKLKQDPAKCELHHNQITIPNAYWDDQTHNLIAPDGIVKIRREPDPNTHIIFFDLIGTEPQ